MNKKIVSIIISFFFFIMVSSGCIDFILNDSTTYQSHPTKIRYDIRYGYEISCIGMGEYEIHYNCDKTEVLLGTVSSINLLHDTDYTYVKNDNVVFWNISGNSDNNYELGITATVQAESFLVSDLNGEDALTIQEINMLHPDRVVQYCHEQTVGNKTYIDPNDPNIKNTSNFVKNQAYSNNAFVLAKSLFVWLKENTDYQIHGNEATVQPASVTYQLETGDCDDLSFLYISLCRSLGIPARFIRGFLIEEKNGMFFAGPHAWAEVFVGEDIGNNGWVPVECAGSSSKKIEIHQNFGVEDAMHLRLFVDEGSNESINLSMSSISWSYSSNMDVTADSFIDIDNYTVLDEKQLVVTKDNIRSYQ